MQIQRLLLKGGQQQNQRLLLKGGQLGGGRRRAATHANPGLKCYLTTREVRTPQCKHCLGKNVKKVTYKTIGITLKQCKNNVEII